MRDLLLAEGNAGLIGSRDTLRLAFRVGLIRDRESWLAMVQARNLTNSTYNRSTAEQVSQQVGDRHLPSFRELRQVLSERVQLTAPAPWDAIASAPTSISPWWRRISATTTACG